MLKVAFFPSATEYGQHVFPLFTPSDSAFEKIAAPTLIPEVTKYIENLRPEPGAQYVLVNAMGSGEFYGSNVNGDYFPEASLIHVPNGWTGVPAMDSVLAKNWPYGYPTFYRAFPFSHHRNKDPQKAYGTVVLAAWNPRMRRVELIIKVEHTKCAEHGGLAVWDKIRAGQFPDVSMGCFTAGNLVTMADGTRKPIEAVCVGDLVLTHRGNAKRVTETHRRQYVGALYSIRAEAHETVTATKQHPFWCVRDDQVKTQDSYRRWRQDADVSPAWVDVEDLQAHHLLEPVVQDVLTPDWVDRAFCRLFGYYLAEGHVLRNKDKKIVGVEFNVHREDAIHDEIEALCEQFGTRNPPSWHDRPHSDSAQGICVFDERLAELCYEHGGGYSQKKRMSYEALRWHPDMQREILGAYANGDGVEANGALKLSTSSTDLAWQWMVILPRLGILASIQNLEHKAGSGFSRRVTYEWVLHIGKQWARGLADVCAKAAPVEVLRAKNSRKILGEYVVTPIRSLEASEETVEVFNLEVEEDASYLVAGLAVHNCRVPFDTCSICLDEALYQRALATFDPRKHPHPGKAALEFHKALKEKNGAGIRGLAVTRKDYCAHARLEMNKIYPDGRKVWVVNDFPNFFDISFVFIGAEKCAKMMMKLAHRAHAYFRLSADVARDLGYLEDGEKVAAASPQLAFERAFEDLLTKDALAKRARTKDAEIIKDTVPSQFAAQAVPLLTAREPDLPKSLVRIMAGLPTEESLGTAASMGVVLRPREFQRLLLTKFGLEDEADDLEKKKIVFPDVEEEEQMDVRPQCFNRLLAGLLLPLLSGRSSFGPSIERRVTILVVGDRPESSRAASPPSELLHKMGSAYKGYRRSLMNAIPQMEPVVRDSSSGELCKLASSSLDNLLTPLSHAYLQEAFMDELGGEKKARASANAQRGLPSKIACAGNQLSHGDSK